VLVAGTHADMHAERDYLVKRVFPELSEWCELRRIRLVDIDLRWGITEADATGDPRAIEALLGRIGECLPLFVCLVGQRLGWVPRVGDAADEARDRLPALDTAIGDRTVALEIELLRSLAQPLPQQIDGAPRVPHAFFYLRDPSYLEAMDPAPPVDDKADPALRARLHRRRIYTDEAEHDAKQRRLLTSGLRDLRETKIPGAGLPVRRYTVRWVPGDHTPELAIPLECPAAIPENVVRWQRAWQRAVGIDVPGMSVGADSEACARALAYNDAITEGRLTDFRCEAGTLAGAVLVDLKAAISARYPERTETIDRTDIAREIMLPENEESVIGAHEGFVEQAGEFEKIDRYVDGDSRKLFVLTGPEGVGKSTLLAAWVAHRRQVGTGEILHCRFIGMCDRSMTVDSLLRYLLVELVAAGEILHEIPENHADVRAKVGELLRDCGKRKRTVIVIDALNQLDSGLSDLEWIPSPLPPGVKIIVSFTSGSAQADALVKRMRLGDDAHVVKSHAFESPEDRKKLAHAYLSRHLKDLDVARVEALVANDTLANPLLLKIALSELRVLGSIADVTAFIGRTAGMTLVSAWDAVLARLESDPPCPSVPMSAAVPLIFGLLAHSKGGLPEQILVEIVREDLGLVVEQRGEVQSAIQAVFGQARYALARRGERYDFLYASFRDAAIARYAPVEQSALPRRPAASWHLRIAALCETWDAIDADAQRYALQHLVHHYLLAGQPERAAEVLVDFAYHYDRLRVLGRGDIAEVGKDFRAVTGARPPGHQIEAWEAFHREISHLIARDVAGVAPEAYLLQLADAHAEKSVVTKSAARWLKERGAGTEWLRSVRKPREALASACLRTFDGHAAAANAVAMGADGTRAVSASDDGTLKVWDLGTGEYLRTLAGHAAAVQAVVLHGDGRRAISASDDGTLKVWDLGTGECLSTIGDGLPEDRGRVLRTIALLPGGKRVVTARAGTLEVWNVEAGKRQSQLVHDDVLEIGAFALSHDGLRIVSACRGILKVWDVATSTCLRTLWADNDSITAIGLCPDGRRIVTASGNGEMKLRDLAVRQCWIMVEAGAPPRTSLPPGTGSGQWRISVTDDGALDVKVSEADRSLCVLSGHAGPVSAIVLCKDGKHAVTASADGTLREWDLDDGECLRTLGSTARKALREPLNAVALSADGRRAVAASGDGTFRVWDLEGGASPQPLEGHDGQVSDLALDPDSNRAVSASHDGTLKVWNPETGACLRTIEGHTKRVNAIALEPGGRRVASASGDGTVKVWDVRTGRCDRTFEGHADAVRAVALHSNGKHVVSAGKDHTLKVWDLTSGQCVSTLEGHTDTVNALLLHADGRRIVSASDDETIRVWSLETGKCVRPLEGHTERVSSIVFLRDVGRVVSASDDHTVRIWNLASGDCVQTLQGHGEAVSAIAVHPDGARVVSASDDRTVKIWDIEKGECLGTLPGHPDPVSAIALRGDGRYLVSASGRTLMVWDTETGTTAGAWVADSAVACCVWVRERILAGTVDGDVLMLELVPQGPWEPPKPRVEVPRTSLAPPVR
jgi:WD40 repeat protein